LGSLPGVIRTRVGYCGGTTKNPTYHNIGDHSETIQIEFDPEKITYAQMLELFWNTHNPCHKAYSRQYMSAIFYQGEAQKKAAEETRSKKEAASGKVHTEIVELKQFYLAEDYHQKYSLRNDSELMNEFNAIYPDAKDFTNSTAAARVNAWLAHSNVAAAKSDVERLGFSAAGMQILLKRIKIDPAR
jgi:peptide-methionine (S)-S-oxide reductase